MLRSLAVGAIVLAVIGGFMALDRTVGHWYVPKQPPRQMTYEDFASWMLGSWDRSIPESARDQNREQALAGDSGPPNVPQGSVAQLAAAFQRIGWAAVWPQVDRDITQYTSDRKKYDIVHDCGGYLFGLHNRMAACNLEPWGE